jgi:hypothetical protein
MCKTNRKLFSNIKNLGKNLLTDATQIVRRFLRIVKVKELKNSKSEYEKAQLSAKYDKHVIMPKELW